MDTLHKRDGYLSNDRSEGTPLLPKNRDREITFEYSLVSL